jgi:hypothetical protein
MAGLSRGSVVVAGAVARRIECGGHVWALLQWALGFRKLGWSVLFLDRLEPAPGLRESALVRRFVETMERFGMGGSFALDLGADEEPVGLGRATVRERVRDADLLLDVMGYLGDAELLARARRRVFLDIDPGFGQMWRALGLCDLFAGHDAFVTVGTRVGRDDCRVPTCGLPWITTLPPVVLDEWPRSYQAGDRFTSVGSWRGPWAPVEFEGERYGLRAHELRRFAAVPHESGLPFELALDIDPADAADVSRLRAYGWRLSDPRVVAGTPEDYRSYVRASRGEFGIAKGMYVRARTGWVSDRTACYLASGRPAIVQDTGFGAALETGAGLLTFQTLEQAVDAVHEVDENWARHARAARELAVERFDSDRVLGALVDAVAASEAVAA